MKKKIFDVLDWTSLELGLRPKIVKDEARVVLPNGEKAGVIISADFELAWAFRFSRKVSDPKKMARQARSNFPIMLELLEQYNIPITWATVGHLMLESCKKGDHDWMTQLPYFTDDHKWNYRTGGWFDCDPYTTHLKDNAWYAPDLIESIKNSKVKHEIACHTFSHIDFSDDNCPKEVARDEIKACIDAAKAWDIKLESMVFPGGSYGNIDMLKEMGFSSYRRNLSEAKLSPVLTDLFGLKYTATSLGLGGVSLDAKSIERHKFRIRKYIQKAKRIGMVCHLWFHPSVTPAYVNEIFPWLLSMLSEEREKGELFIGTMSTFSKL